MFTRSIFNNLVILTFAFFLFTLGCNTIQAQNNAKNLPPSFKEVDSSNSELENLVSRFHSDRRLFNRFYSKPRSKAETLKFNDFLNGWLKNFRIN